MLRVFAVSLAPAFAVVLSCQQAAAQKAAVTFYSPPDPFSHQLKEGATWWGTSPLRGYVFDGDRQLAHFVAGKFITFELPTGQHLFSGTIRKDHPNENHPLVIEAKDGDHYFVRLTMRWKGNILYVVNPQLETVDCSTAIKENAGSHALELKHISKDAQTLIAQPAHVVSCR